MSRLKTHVLGSQVLLTSVSERHLRWGFAVACNVWRTDLMRLYRRLMGNGEAFPLSSAERAVVLSRARKLRVHTHVCGLPLANSTIAPLNKALVSHLCRQPVRQSGIGIGVAFAAPLGTPVRAVQSGCVVHAGWDDGYGTHADILHDDGITARYAHMERLGARVRTGARIINGQPIGTVGMTGQCPEPQLHFSVMQPSGRSGDPLDYLCRLNCLRPA